MQIEKIIPCLDIDEGRVVKGIKFEDIKDAGDPVELAKKYNNDGADELIFSDIGASHKSSALLLDVIKKVAKEVKIPLCVGGGIRTVDDMRAVMDAGANKVSVCSSALDRPELLREMANVCGSRQIVLSIDAKRVPNADGSLRWHAFSKGGRIDTGVDAIEWAVRAVELGAGEILLNSIDADGTGAGYDLELTRRVKNAVAVPVIASGGAGSLEQIANVLLSTANPEMGDACQDEAPGADAALVASLLHFGKTTIREIKDYVESKGVCVSRKVSPNYIPFSMQ